MSSTFIEYDPEVFKVFVKDLNRYYFDGTLVYEEGKPCTGEITSLTSLMLYVHEQTHVYGSSIHSIATTDSGTVYVSGSLPIPIDMVEYPKECKKEDQSLCVDPLRCNKYTCLCEKKPASSVVLSPATPGGSSGGSSGCGTSCDEGSCTGKCSVFMFDTNPPEVFKSELCNDNKNCECDWNGQASITLKKKSGYTPGEQWFVDSTVKCRKK